MRKLEQLDHVLSIKPDPMFTNISIIVLYGIFCSILYRKGGVMIKLSCAKSFKTDSTMWHLNHDSFF